MLQINNGTFVNLERSQTIYSMFRSQKADGEYGGGAHGGGECYGGGAYGGGGEYSGGGAHGGGELAAVMAASYGGEHMAAVTTAAVPMVGELTAAVSPNGGGAYGGGAYGGGEYGRRCPMAAVVIRMAAVNTVTVHGGGEHWWRCTRRR